MLLSSPTKQGVSLAFENTWLSDAVTFLELNPGLLLLLHTRAINKTDEDVQDDVGETTFPYPPLFNNATNLKALHSRPNSER